MSWDYINLKEVIDKPISGEWGDGDGETNVIRTTNFSNDGKLDLGEVVKRNITIKKIDQKKLIYGDTIIEKSGGSPTQPVGRVVYFDQSDETFLCNNFTSVIRGNSRVDKRYLFWFLFNNHLTQNTLKYQNKTTGIINLQLERYINELQIPLPPVPMQKRIAEILDAADALKRKDQEMLKKYDELAQAIFIDMFGDPVRNEKGWEVDKLSNLLAEGEKITYGVVQPGDNLPNGIPIVRVGDFKLMRIEKSNLKRIDPAIEKPYNRTRLIGDEVLVACVGSVGKIALADESLKGFNIVRATAKVRVDSTLINRVYLAFHLSQKSIQNYFVSETRTSSQPTLNIKQIEETSILVPPIELQNQFNLLSTNILDQMAILQKEESETLFNSLIEKAFKGELIA
jgi:type I restriction enzyme, S subunit